MATETQNWASVCNATPDDNVQNGMPNAEDLVHVLNQAKIAKNKAEPFVKNELVKMFKRDYEGAKSSYANVVLPWLPKIPKQLDEPVPQEILESLKCPQAVIEIYTHLQRVGVGIEQSILDEEEKNGPFSDAFNESSHYLKSVLCELQIALINKNIPPPSDMTKDIMGDQQYNKDNTSTSLRNWAIYRDYLNLLDYIIQVLDYITKTVA